jgi:hypothetical protein
MHQVFVSHGVKLYMLERIHECSSGDSAGVHYGQTVRAGGGSGGQGGSGRESLVAHLVSKSRRVILKTQ